MRRRRSTERRLVLGIELDRLDASRALWHESDAVDSLLAPHLSARIGEVP